MSKQDSELVINGISSYNQQKGEKKKKKKLVTWKLDPGGTTESKSIKLACFYQIDCHLWAAIFGTELSEFIVFYACQKQMQTTTLAVLRKLN